jgi:hypothetical protein
MWWSRGRRKKPGRQSFTNLYSIGEVRSDRSGSAAEWSTREMLIYLLRMLDTGGVKADAMVVIWRNASGEIEFAQVSPDHDTSVGIAAKGLHAIIHGRGVA